MTMVFIKYVPLITATAIITMPISINVIVAANTAVCIFVSDVISLTAPTTTPF